MSRFVVDASVAIKWMVTEPGTSDALTLLDGPSLAAPDLIIAECANILWKKVGRANLGSDQALVAAELLEGLDLDLRPMTGLVRTATRLAIELDHPAYDCFYLALAAAEACPFVTADLRLVRKLAGATSVGVSVLSLEEAATRVSPA